MRAVNPTARQSSSDIFLRGKYPETAFELIAARWQLHQV
jgi:hypothetical protein